MKNPFEAPVTPESVDIDVSEFEKKPTQEDLETREKANRIREATKELKDRQRSPYEEEKYEYLKKVLEKYNETGELDDVGTV